MKLFSGTLPQVFLGYLGPWASGAAKLPWEAITAVVAGGSLFAALTGAAWAVRDTRPRWWMFGVAVAVAGMAAAIPRLCVSDELFMALVQSKELCEHGRYSFQPDENVDGTSDLLPYVLVAATGRAGVSIPLSALLLSVGSGIGCALLAARVIQRRTGSRLAAVAVGLASVLSPAIGYPAASGFAATLWTLLILSGLNAWTAGCRRAALGWTAVAGLVRYDAAVMSLILLTLLAGEWTFSARSQERFRILVSAGLSALLPLALVFGWRWYYGHWVPTPILLKRGLEISTGLHRLRDYVFTVFVPVGVIVIAVVASRETRGRLMYLWPWGLIAAGQIAVITLGGGDYLLGHRHFVLASMLLLLAVGEWMGYAASFCRQRSVAASTVLVLTIATMLAGPPTQDALLGLKDVGPNDTQPGISAILNGKVAKYAAAGRFFRSLAPPEGRLASRRGRSRYRFLLLRRTAS